MSNQKYDEAFKRNAVQLVESGQTGAQVARDLGVPANQLYAWCQRYRTRPSSHGNASQNQDETTRLRKELARTQMELDILKKAMSIFARPETTRSRRSTSSSLGSTCATACATSAGFWR